MPCLSSAMPCLSSVLLFLASVLLFLASVLLFLSSVLLLFECAIYRPSHSAISHLYFNVDCLSALILQQLQQPIRPIVNKAATAAC